jgi:undecaprenyl-diphosphatase
VTAWDAFLLGIVQGATEFLPVSSSGHLVIVQSLLSVSVEGVAFEVTDLHFHTQDCFL